MPGYKLSGKALRDVAEIVTFLHRESGASVADRAEHQLFAAFRDLAEQRAIGHRRADLTQKNVLFYTSHPYVIIFRRSTQIHIIRVVHGSRDIANLI